MLITRKERKESAQFRFGVAPLRLEADRWEKNDINNHRIPSEES